MSYTRLSAAEAASLIPHNATMALGGFTPNGNPKAVFRELSKRAVRLHEQGEEFKVGLLTGASSCQSIEGDMAKAGAIKFRAPFSTNTDFRRHCNLGEIDYEDMHLGHMAERMRRGFYGEMDWCILECSRIDEGETECRAYLTSAGGIATTAARLAKHVILELNHFHSPKAHLLHDTFEPKECGWGREPFNIRTPYDRLGNDYVAIEPAKDCGHRGVRHPRRGPEL